MKVKVVPFDQSQKFSEKSHILAKKPQVISTIIEKLSSAPQDQKIKEVTLKTRKTFTENLKKQKLEKNFEKFVNFSFFHFSKSHGAKKSRVAL